MNPWYIYLSNNNFYHFFFAKEGDPSDSKDNNKTSGIHLPIYLFNHSFTLSFIHSFIHSFIQSFIHSFTHSFIHSFILFFAFYWFMIHYIFHWQCTLYTPTTTLKETPPKVRRDIREQIWYYFNWKYCF